MAKKKSDTAEVAQRVAEILRIRLDGAQYHDVLQLASENAWNVSERQLREYMRRADDLLVERMERNRRRLVARHIAQRETLFARAVNGADYRTALSIADSTAKLQGLFSDGRDVKELARLATTMISRVAELERRLADANRNQTNAPAGSPAAGPVAGSDAGEGGRQDSSVPGGPDAVDG